MECHSILVHRKTGHCSLLAWCKPLPAPTVYGRPRRCTNTPRRCGSRHRPDMWANTSIHRRSWCIPQWSRSRYRHKTWCTCPPADPRGKHRRKRSCRRRQPRFFPCLRHCRLQTSPPKRPQKIPTKTDSSDRQTTKASLVFGQRTTADQRQFCLTTISKSLDYTDVAKAGQLLMRKNPSIVGSIGQHLDVSGSRSKMFLIESME